MGLKEREKRVTGFAVYTCWKLRTARRRPARAISHSKFLFSRHKMERRAEEGGTILRSSSALPPSRSYLKGSAVRTLSSRLPIMKYR